MFPIFSLVPESKTIISHLISETLSILKFKLTTKLLYATWKEKRGYLGELEMSAQINPFMKWYIYLKKFPPVLLTSSETLLSL